MKYVVVLWDHFGDDEPIELYHEITASNWEHRRVEKFRDGRLGFADQYITDGKTELAWEPIFPVEEIQANGDAEFSARSLTQEEFETMWAEALQQHGRRA